MSKPLDREPDHVQTPLVEIPSTTALVVVVWTIVGQVGSVPGASVIVLDGLLVPQMLLAVMKAV
jgi:hypothetical protein